MSPTRLDILLVDRKLAPSRKLAQALIMAGKVDVNGQRVDKPGKSVPDDATIEVRNPQPPYVSRGGTKLEGALDALKIDPAGRVCLDVGQSTGGFTDCLLKHGAKHVTGVDVGYGQVALSLRNHQAVTVIERTNFRHFDPAMLLEPVDLVVIDVSFISLTLILPVAKKCLKPGGTLLAMIKPQFEVGKGQVGSGGVVRDPEKHIEVVEKVRAFARENLDLELGETAPSPITGPKGNLEFFCVFFKKKPYKPETAV